MKQLDELSQLACKYGCDKFGEQHHPTHCYTPHYHRLFKSMRGDEIKLLEIGVGGYENSWGGCGLRMWKEYFPKGEIVSLDIYDKSNLQEDQIKIYQGNQTNTELLQHINRESGPFNIIIDDGSHINSHVIKTFQVLFPLLVENGIYIVEDIQTSYCGDYGGDSYNLENKTTSMNYFKSLLDEINYAEIDNPFYKPHLFAKHIIAMTFIHNLVFVHKGANDIKSEFLNCEEKKRDSNFISKLYYICKQYFTGPKHPPK